MKGSMIEAERELTTHREDDSIDLLELLVRFVSLWRTGLVTFVIAFAVGALVIYGIKPLYEATVTILPSETPQQTNSLSAMFSGKRPGDSYVGLLKSRTVADEVIGRTGLMSLYRTTSADMARGALAGATKITEGTDGLIEIKVRNETAQVAARIANAYLDALQQQHESMALVQAEHSREIFGKQLQQEKDALAAAEEDLRRTQERSGIVQDQAQTQIGLNAIALISGQITTLRVQLASLLLGSTEENPQVKALRSQIAQLEARERSLQTGTSKTTEGAAVSVGRMPELNLEFERKQREVKYHELVFTALLNQIQNTKMTEAASSMSFEIVDRASVPEFRAWPPRKLLLLVSFAASVLLAVVAMVLHIFFRHVLADPMNQEHLHELRRQFALGR